jgi:hypothetical protein
MVALLGAWHGLNPGMGWLFAVALGLQSGSARAVWRALPPLALGHAAAVCAALLFAIAAGRAMNQRALEWIVAVVLFGFGVARLIRTRHPRFGGMTVNARDLTVWSALMASAHGAGLMLVPFALRDNAAHSHAVHVMSMVPNAVRGRVEIVALHSAAYLAVTGLAAAAVYHRYGVRILRTHWVNLDIIWSGALIVTAIVVAM